MKKLTVLGLAAALLLSGTGLSIAQDQPAAPGGAAAGATSAMPSFSGMMSSIQAAATTAPDLSAITDTTTVNIVTVSSLQSEAGADPAALDAAMTANEAMMTTMHSNIEANAALKAKLEAAGHSSEDVVAVTAEADGSFTVYVDDRA